MFFAIKYMSGITTVLLLYVYINYFNEGGYAGLQDSGLRTPDNFKSFK